MTYSNGAKRIGLQYSYQQQKSNNDYKDRMERLAKAVAFTM